MARRGGGGRRAAICSARAAEAQRQSYSYPTAALLQQQRLAPGRGHHRTNDRPDSVVV